MNKYENDILNNKNLDAPDENELSKAKSILPDKKKHYKLNKKQIFAIASVCVAILIIVICIPLMIPAQGDLEYVKNEDLQVNELESIDSFNKATSNSILHFGSNTYALEYSYKNKTMFIEEYSSVNDSSIALLVEITGNTAGFIFEKPDEYSKKLIDTKEYRIAEKVFFWTEYDDAIYLMLNYDGIIYYIKIENNLGDWKNTLNFFIN